MLSFYMLDFQNTQATYANMNIFNIIHVHINHYILPTHVPSDNVFFLRSLRSRVVCVYSLSPCIGAEMCGIQ